MIRLLIALALMAPGAACAETISTNTFDDGCVVVYKYQDAIEEMTPRVINPLECPDKQFVYYLNCFDKEILPVQDRPVECR